MRISRLVGTLFTALAVVVVISQAALAQREEGRRGGGGFRGMFGQPTAGRLLGVKEVQEALKLNEEQTTKIEKINDDMREEMRKAFDGGFDREKMVEVVKNTSNKINEVLDAAQQKRLMGILIQVNGASAVNDPAVAKELNITEDQKKKLDEVRMSVREQLSGLRDLSQEERGKKMEEVQADINKKILAELTDDQQKQLDSLKGEKVDIDPSKLRGPGGGDRNRNRGERGRGGRDRESKGEEKSGT